MTRRIRFIDKVRNEQVYGLFPQFEGFLDREEIRRFGARLTQFTADVASAFVAQVPPEWEVGDEARSAWAAMITERAQFVAETIETKLWPQQQLNQGGTV